MHLLSPLLLVLALTVVAAEAGVEIERAGGQARFTIESSSVSDLSGITWMGGDSFAAVSDKRKVIQFLTLRIDRGTGEITGGRLGEVREVPAKPSDFEGITWVSAEKAFYLSAEVGNSVIRLIPGTGAMSTLPIPGVFRLARPNLGLESIAWNEAARHFWIANEEALTPDGPVSSGAAGSLVRLQKLDATFRPLAQYAWRTEPAAFRYGNAGSGLSDLCLLPNGQLIVLERGFAGIGLHQRLFLADFTRATDVSRSPRFEGMNPVAAGKTLLFEESTGFTNFEGLALGPPLANGWRSLIVVADSNGTPTHTFLALKIRFDAKPAPEIRKRAGK